MAQWKLSTYTNVVRCADGEILLHNSFMGALAQIPSRQTVDVESCLAGEFDYSRIEQTPIRELCDAGFFVPASVDERSVVRHVLERERDSGFHLIILPHENCNFRCTYCYETFERGRMHPDVVAGLKALMARRTQDVSSVAVLWFGGEPLLARETIFELSDSFLEDCERRSVRYSSNITTNGYFLDEVTVDALLARRITSFQVTLDGPQDTHDRARKLAGGGPTYKIILENLEAMRRRSDEFFVRIRVNFSRQHTAPIMERFLREMQSVFGGDPRFGLAFHAVGKWGGPNDSELDVCDEASAAAFRATLMEEAVAHGFPTRTATEGLHPHGAVCYAGRSSSIVVGADGTVYKCTVALYDPRNHVGRIMRSGELEIDQARWDLWTKLDGKNVRKCSTCSYSPSCQSRGCPLVAIELGEPHCPISRSGYESMVTLAAFEATGRSTSGIKPGRLQRPPTAGMPLEVREAQFGRWDYRS